MSRGRTLTKERRWAVWAYLVAPLTAFWALLLLGPRSSSLSVESRLGVGLAFSVFWCGWIWLRELRD